ncbi:MAG: ABC transporter ATP-binding protein [Prevotellaceae bacterium]|jgi:ABC-2 type transport system ATP-binding protein|nr:ABC transporter ATP-binding protein [Prevotellaceae bacterium]
MNVLTLNGITKHYRTVTALQDVSFTVPKGTVFGILGPNGSGKTTLLGIVTDVLRASAGTYMFYDGAQPVNEIRRDMGVLLETPNFYPYLSARKNLEIVAKIKKCDPAQIEIVLRQVGLIERQSSHFKTFSLGMKQRLAIASTLLSNPSIVILDEPTNGLDPEGISEIRQLIKQLAAEGKTVILASHLLDEVEKVCTHVAILKQGKLLASGSVDGALRRKTTAAADNFTGEQKETAFIEVHSDDLDALETLLKKLPQALETNRADGLLTIVHHKGELTAMQVNQYCFDKGIVLDRLVAKSKNLESKFLEITK